MKLRALPSIVMFGLLLGLAAPAFAQQPPTAQDQAAAEGLFGEAKKLMADGKFAEACPKLEESQRLDPAPGTQFKLGECYEQIGKTASAWALFLNVAAAAKSAGMPDREKIARDRAAELEPKLPKIVITMQTPSPDVEVKRDGVVVGAAQYGSAVAVDPGKHTITASAPGKEPWSSNIDVAGGIANVVVPPLKEAAAAPPPITDTPPSEPGDKRGLGTQKTLALVAGGVGVVGVGLGAVFGLNAMSTLDEANDGHCNGNACDAEGVALREDAVSAGNVSTIAFGVGLVGLAGAAVLWLTAPSSSSSSSRAKASLHVVPGKNGALLGGSF